MFITRVSRLLTCIVLVSLLASLNAQPAPSSIPDPKTADTVYTLNEFVVSTPADSKSIRADETLGAMRIATSLIDTPIAVSVLNAEFLQSFLVIDDGEALSYVAGAGPSDGPQGNGNSLLRGYEPMQFRNGFDRQRGSSELVNLDRIEIIKGPLAATFGRTNPGGVINYITKRPQRRPFFSAGTTFGSYGLQRGELSASGPTGAKGLYYRFDASHTNQNGVAQFEYNRYYAVSGALTYELSKDTSITMELEVFRRTLNQGTAGAVKQYATFLSPVSGLRVSNMVGGIEENLVRSGFNQAGPHSIVDRGPTVTFDLRAEHRFNAVFSMRVNLQQWQRRFISRRWNPANYNVTTGRFLQRSPYRQEADNRNIAGQIDFLASFKTRSIPHKLLFSIDASTRGDVDSREFSLPTAVLNALPASLLSLDPKNPDWSNWYSSSAGEASRATKIVKGESLLQSALLSERVSFIGGRIQLFGSLRLERAKVNYVDYLVPANTAKRDVAQPTYSTGGVLHLLGEKLVLFANTSTGFNTNSTIDRGTGELQENPRSKGVEYGVKGSVLQNQIYWTASAFQIDRTKVAETNPAYVVDETGVIPAGIPQFVGSGSERIRGYEFEASGNLSAQVLLRVAYGFTDAYTSSSNTDSRRVGVTLLNAAKHNANLALIYRPSQSRFRGVSLGASLLYMGEFFGRFGVGGSEVTGTGLVTNRLRLNYGPTNRIEEVRPDSTQYNAFLRYEFKTGKARHTLGLNVKNVTDQEVWTSSGRLNLGRSFQGSYALKY